MTSDGFGGGRLDLRFGDRLTGADATVDALVVHGSSSRLNFARIGIAWIVSWVASTIVKNDHLDRVAGAIRPDDQPTVGIFASVLDEECMMDVLVGETVLSRRVVNQRRAAVARGVNDTGPYEVRYDPSTEGAQQTRQVARRISRAIGELSSDPRRKARDRWPASRGSGGCA
jgi:hypothetical protein